MDILNIDKETMQRIDKTIAVAFTYHERYHMIINKLDDASCQISLNNSMADMGIKTLVDNKSVIQDSQVLLEKMDLPELFKKHNELIPDALTNELVGHMFLAKKANDMTNYNLLKKEVIQRMI